MDASRLQQYFADAAAKVTGSELLLPANQTQANAIGIRLAWLIVHEECRLRRMPTLYALQGRAKDGTDHFTGIGLENGKDYERQRYEFLTDIFLTRHVSPNVEEPLLAAEVEAAPGHNVDYSRKADNRDYWWDCEKLLYVNAPRRLFVARVQADRLPTLCETLISGYRDTWPLRRRGETNMFVVMPSRKSEWHLVRFGVASGRSSRLSLEPVPATKEI